MYISTLFRPNGKKMYKNKRKIEKVSRMLFPSRRELLLLSLQGTVSIYIIFLWPKLAGEMQPFLTWGASGSLVAMLIIAPNKSQDQGSTQANDFY